MNEPDELQRLMRQFRTANERSTAGFILGSLPKKQRHRWTGWLNGHHLWRGRRVVLPDGRAVEVYCAVRGQVIVRWHDPYSVNPIRDAIFSSGDLTILKLPAAVALGRAKRGVRERPSVIKAITSRLNGRMPPRPGRQPRGRPRKPRLAGSM